MGITRRAARLCFASLLIGAGAAAVAAKPSSHSSTAMVDVVDGDPRLDLEWALAQSGMSPQDARRVSVMFVDQIDPNAEQYAFNVNWAAEVWWAAPESERSTGAPLRMRRAYLGFQVGTTLQKLGNALPSPCPLGSQPFYPLRVASSALAPIPVGTTVIVRLRGLSYCGEGTAIGTRDLVPVGPDASLERTPVRCEPVTLDPESGLDVPREWATNR